MTCTLELSFYPLTENYTQRIDTLIKQLANHGDIRILVNGLSTQLIGDYEIVMDVLKRELRIALSAVSSVAVIKLTLGEHSPENLPEYLKELNGKLSNL